MCCVSLCTRRFPYPHAYLLSAFRLAHTRLAAPEDFRSRCSSRGLGCAGRPAAPRVSDCSETTRERRGARDVLHDARNKLQHETHRAEWSPPIQPNLTTLMHTQTTGIRLVQELLARRTRTFLLATRPPSGVGARGARELVRPRSSDGGSVRPARGRGGGPGPCGAARGWAAPAAGPRVRPSPRGRRAAGAPPRATCRAAR